MRRRLAGAILLGLLGSPHARAEPTVVDPAPESIEALPPGDGRDETFGLCTACHGFRLVASQGMSRAQWDETLTWMTLRHGMPEVLGGERDLILDYLERHYPPRAPARAGGFRNPFPPP
jgi:hypothetical protein